MHFYSFVKKKNASMFNSEKQVPKFVFIEETEKILKTSDKTA